MAKQYKVAANLAQDFTDTEKLQARNNIGAGDGKISWVTIPEGGQPQITKSGLSVVTRPSGSCIQDDAGNIKFYLAPDFAAGDAGKVLSISNGGVIEWKNVPTELPTHTAQDADKFLTIDSNGNLVWVKAHPSVLTDSFNSSIGGRNGSLSIPSNTIAFVTITGVCVFSRNAAGVCQASLSANLGTISDRGFCNVGEYSDNNYNVSNSISFVIDNKSSATQYNVDYGYVLVTNDSVSRNAFISQYCQAFAVVFG